MTVSKPLGNPPSLPWPVVLLTSFVVLTGGAVLAYAGLSGLRGLPWFWLVTCALAEAGWIRLPDGRSTLSMGSIANFAAVLVLPLDQAMWCATIACLAVESVVMRKPLPKALYNCAGTAIVIALTSAVLHAVPSTASGAGPAALFAALVMAAMTYYLCNRALVIAVVALDQRLTVAQVWHQDFGLRRDAVPSAAALSLGVLLAHEYQGLGPLALVLLVLPATLVLDAHRRSRPEGSSAATDGRRPGTTDNAQRAA